MISNLIKKLLPSPTLTLDAQVKDLQAKGIPIINLALGEPDFPTPSHISQAAIIAIQEGFTHYTPTSGILELKKAIQNKFLKENDIYTDPSCIVVGVGSKQLLFHAIMCLVQKNDEVLLPTPTWSTYAEQIKLSQATPVFVPLKPPFMLKASDLEKKITKKTKLILLNSPSNPTGAMITRTELMKIADLAVRKNIYVLSDEIYEHLCFDKKHYSIASFNKKIQELTVTINGFSKSYAMTGWRIGYATGPKEIMTAMTGLQSQTTSNTCSISQKAGIIALTGSQKPRKDMRMAFARRRTYILKSLSKIDTCSLTPPSGAFYFLIDIRKSFTTRIDTSEKWAQQLLEKEHIAVVPGEAFFAPGYIRLSFASSLENLREGTKRIIRFMKSHE